MTVSVLIPAHNEAAYLPACLDALLASEGEEAVEVIIIANGCTDDTAAIARAYADQAGERDWDWIVLDLAQGGKLNALNAGERRAQSDTLVYLDADVQVSPPLIAQLAEALDTYAPRYASGRPNVTVSGDDALTRHYTRFWLTTPFMVHGVPGFGVFAMNRSGRARWAEWPDIISDDTFARLHFAPSERLRVEAGYDWPMIEGFRKLVQVRRRQDLGVAEIARRYPALMANDDPHDQTVPLWRRVLKDPVAFAAFAAVRSTIRLPVLRSDNRWARGR